MRRFKARFLVNSLFGFMLIGVFAFPAQALTKGDIQKKIGRIDDLFEQATTLLRQETQATQPIDVDKAILEEKTDKIRNDFLVPTSPAFTVLGVTPEEVSEPKTPRELAASLLNGIDGNGNLQSGIAIDFAPYWTFKAKHLTLGEYRTSWSTRAFARTQFSIATTKGSSDDDQALRAALGVRIPLLDRGDRRLSKRLDSCLQESSEIKTQRDAMGSKLDTEFSNLMGIVHGPKLADMKSKIEQGATSAELDEMVPSLDQMIAKAETLVKEITDLKPAILMLIRQHVADCSDKTMKFDWNATNVAIGFAGILFGADGNFDDFDGEGYAAYLTAGYGFEGVPGLDETSQILFHTRFRRNDQQPLGDGSELFREQDTLVIGGQLRIALAYEKNLIQNILDRGKPTFVLVFEGDYVRADVDGGGVDESYKFSGGADFKISEKVNLKLTIGGETGKETDTNAAFVLGGLKWAF